MHIAALIVGILSLVIFSWLGPTIGAGAATASLITSGEVGAGGYVWGILVGFIVPLLAVVFGFMGMKKSKGMAITGIVLGGISAIIGLILTFLFVGGISAGMGALQEGLGDPAFQQMMQQGLDQAMQEAMQQAGQAVPQ